MRGKSMHCGRMNNNSMQYFLIVPDMNAQIMVASTVANQHHRRDCRSPSQSRHHRQPSRPQRGSQPRKGLPRSDFAWHANTLQLCRNTRPDCDQLARQGWCTRNPQWMRDHCPVSCGMCPGDASSRPFFPSPLPIVPFVSTTPVRIHYIIF